MAGFQQGERRVHRSELPAGTQVPFL
jgi:hypothetical protein